MAPLVFGSIIIGAAVGTLDASFKDGIQKIIFFVILKRETINLKQNYLLAEIRHFIRNSKPRLIFCDSAIVGRLKNIVNDLNINSDFISIDDDQFVDGARSVSDLFKETGTEDLFR